MFCSDYLLKIVPTARGLCNFIMNWHKFIICIFFNMILQCIGLYNKQNNYLMIQKVVLNFVHDMRQ